MRLRLVEVRVAEAVGDRPRNPSVHVPCVELGALLHQVLRDDVDASVRCPVQGRHAEVVHGVHVVAERDAHPDRLEHLVFLTRQRPSILTRVPSGNAAADVEGAYNDFWWDSGGTTSRTTARR